MISVGITPFANDIYAFNGLYRQKIDSKLNYEFEFLDIEQLNARSLKGLGDVLKVSFSAFAHVLDDYTLLPIGSCLGTGNGPKIVTKKGMNLAALTKLRLAIPGTQTTAYMLYKSLCPQAKEELCFPYHLLLDKLEHGECDAALLIHESRFQIEEKGLHELADLFELWDQKTQAPLPLGGIIAKRSLGKDTLASITNDLYKSLIYSRSHPKDAVNAVLEHSIQKDPELAKKNIDLYVTEDTFQLSETGTHAIQSLLNLGSQAGLLPPPKDHWLFRT